MNTAGKKNGTLEMDKQNPYCLIPVGPTGKDTRDAPTRHSSTLPHFRGVLLCRRCDVCGARISIKGEAKDRVILKCPECQKEYTFFERTE